NPSAHVGAVDERARYVSVPDAVPVGEHPLLRGRWALDHVAPQARGLLAEAWRVRREQGVVSVRVALVTGGEATFHMFSLTDELGADVIVAVPHDGDLAAALDAQAMIAPSRFCRTVRDEAGRTLEVDAAAPEVLGISEEELLAGRPPLERIHPDDHAVVIEAWLATLANPDEGQRTRARLLRGNTTWTWFEITNFNRLDDPERPHILTEMLDISDEMAAHEAVAAREQLLHRLAEALPLGVLQLDADCNVVYKNDALNAIVGAADATTMEDQFAAVTTEDQPQLQKAFAVALEDGSDDDVEGRRAAGDRLVRVITKALTTTGGEVSGVIACITDVTEATLIGRELERRATYDALTSCLNRAAILARLESALAPGPGGAAAVFIDLDGFKSVNDTFGHAVGDEVLATAARALDGTTRSTDVVGRIGGDEFLVVCQDVRDSTMALQLAERIGAELHATRVDRTGVALRGSVGVAWAARGSTDAEHLVRRADEAMYESKREGEGRPHLAA
ncbi:MAG: hypothetical protein QOD30_457, partial [Actinomycetota bacterium]|nr:hypothetical protein [Actinomycetota bacterium]